MIHYDRTKFAVLAYCDCGWRELMITPEGARQTAADHERNVHPDRTQARDAARRATYRHPDDEAAP